MSKKKTLPDISIKFNAEYSSDCILIEIGDKYAEELSVRDLDVGFLSSLLEYLGYNVNLDTTHKFDHDED